MWVRDGERAVIVAEMEVCGIGMAARNMARAVMLIVASAREQEKLIVPLAEGRDSGKQKH